jgi:hypothetical protein
MVKNMWGGGDRIVPTASACGFHMYASSLIFFHMWLRAAFVTYVFKRMPVVYLRFN